MMIGGDDARAVFEVALKGGADFAELFLEDREDLSIDYSAGVSGAAAMHSYGAGLYLLRGNQGTYVYLNDVGKDALLRSVSEAMAIMQASPGASRPVPAFKKAVRANPCPVEIAPGSADMQKKIGLLREADRVSMREACVRSTALTWFDRDQRIRVLNSEGLDAEDRRVTCRMRFIPVVSSDGETASSFSEYCAAAGVESFLNGVYLDRVREHIRDLRESLSAVDAPSCRVPVVLAGGGCSGTFFHEACGHQLETRSLLAGGIFWDRRGERIASEKVTLIDDGTLPGMYGSSRFDDEGMPRQRNVLIENGVLKGFMADRLGARRLGLERTGSGRRQDYAHAPGPRMSNTFLAAGQDDEKEMIASLPEGLYVTGIGGGTGGREFTLLASTAYWIKNGEIGPRVRGAILVGSGEETMLKIDRVAKQFVQEQGGGSFCGADSGFIPTTTSGPAMRIGEMVVGGKGKKL